MLSWWDKTKYQSEPVTVKATCPECGDIDLRIEDVTVEKSSLGLYFVTACAAGHRIRKPVAETNFRALHRAGARRSDVPVEDLVPEIEQYLQWGRTT